jgi:hypothetical protein
LNESIDFGKHGECIRNTKEVAMVFLYTFIYKLLVKKFGCKGTVTSEAMKYILYYLYIFPVTFECLSQSIGINIVKESEAKESEDEESEDEIKKY